MTMPVIEATNAPNAKGCITTGNGAPIPPANKKAPENKRPVIEARRKFPADNHIPRYIKKNTRKQGIDKLFIVVKLYGAKAFCGKVIIEKLEDVKLSKNLPYVVVGSGVINGVGVIVIYGGESALTILTKPSAHIIETILEMCFLKSSIELYNINNS